MTIFQRMLILPILSLPLLALANANLDVFVEISNIFTDTVAAGENEWIHNSVERNNRLAAH